MDHADGAVPSSRRFEEIRSVQCYLGNPVPGSAAKTPGAGVPHPGLMETLQTFLGSVTWGL